MLDDFESAPISDQLRATLRLLKKMTLDHRSLTRDDARAAMSAGVSKAAIHDALEVAFLFNIYDRLADTMGWHVPAKTSGYYQVASKRLLTSGYR